MLDYALVGLIIMSGTSPGQYRIEYQSMGQYRTLQQCSRALGLQPASSSKLYTCLKIDKD